MEIAKAELLAALRELAEQHLGVEGENMRPEAALSAVGIDSFQFIELVFLVEEKFSITIDLENLRANTVADILDTLHELVTKRELGT